MDQNQHKEQYSAYQLAEIASRWFQLQSMYEKKQNDYGTGELYTSTEAHTVTLIEDNPGITVTQIAVDTFRTKSAVSQMVSKLEAKGLIRREQNPRNAKQQLLYVTEKGLELSHCHKQYDEAMIPLKDLIALFGPESVGKFADIIQYVINHMQKRMQDCKECLKR